jgi:hypothetical protein
MGLEWELRPSGRIYDGDYRAFVILGLIVASLEFVLVRW